MTSLPRMSAGDVSKTYFLALMIFPIYLPSVVEENDVSAENVSR